MFLPDGFRTIVLNIMNCQGYYFLSKPFDIEYLIVLINKYIH
jgi:hypothetical protein